MPLLVLRVLMALGAGLAFRSTADAGEPVRTVLDLQPFRQSQDIAITDAVGHQGSATLIDLNPAVHAWYALSLRWGDLPARVYHLQNPTPATQILALDANFSAGVVLRSRAGSYRCPLWQTDMLAVAGARRVPYVPLCDGRLYLRNRVTGTRTELEATVEFLRDGVPGGETILGLVKSTLFHDAARETAPLAAAAAPPMSAPAGPLPAQLGAAYTNRLIGSGSLGITLDTPTPQHLGIGRWSAAHGLASVYVSLIEPRAADSAKLAAYRDRVNGLDGIEDAALVYLVAFDLRRYALHFVMGTEHPRVEWSSRPPAAVRSTELPGPDGIGTVQPLVMTGMVPPWHAADTLAVFAGGFKRSHGAFQSGPLSLVNGGSHYGFIEDGVILSRLQPGLATVLVRTDGGVTLETWTHAGNDGLTSVRYARQNGVPLMAWDGTARRPVPGALVSRWGPGNWSGSANESLRTTRAGVCLQQTATARWLIYAYFSSATPSAMARVFQAYDCHYAMLLDMNALVHTYLAVYPHVDTELRVEHLVAGMSQADPVLNGRPLPRFLAAPDNRDFFYLTPRTDSEQADD